MVLEEFKDVIPAKLPKRLLRREVNHALEWELRAKPAAFTPYYMAPARLEELRRQLQEQLDVGYIHTYKSPDDALVLFQKKHDESL